MSKKAFDKIANGLREASHFVASEYLDTEDARSEYLQAARETEDFALIKDAVVVVQRSRALQALIEASGHARSDANMILSKLEANGWKLIWEK